MQIREAAGFLGVHKNMNCAFPLIILAHTIQKWSLNNISLIVYSEGKVEIITPCVVINFENCFCYNIENFEI